MPKKGLMKALDIPQPRLRAELCALQQDFADDMGRTADEDERLILSQLLDQVIVNVERQDGTPQQRLQSAAGIGRPGAFRRVAIQYVALLRRWFWSPPRHRAQWRLLVNDIYAGVPASNQQPSKQNRRGSSRLD